MLLLQWFSWWGHIPHLEADERLGHYTSALLADSGWTMDRESVLDSWRSLAGGLSQGTRDTGDVAGSVRMQSRKVWQWLKQAYGGGIS